MRNRLGHCAYYLAKVLWVRSKSMIYIWITFCWKCIDGFHLDHWFFFIIMSAFTGKFNDIYHDYNIHTWAVEFVLLVGSLFLFIGMGINYRYWIKKQKKNPREQSAGGTGKDVVVALKVPDEHTAEDTVWT